MQHRVETLFDQPLPRPVDGREAGAEGCHDAFVTPTLTSLRNIGLEQDLSLQNLTGGVRALANNRFQRSTFFRAQSDDVLLDLDPWHDPIPGNVDDVARESQIPVGFNDASH